ncbi:PHP domain-containing protein [Halorussus gelatinilyticus]|uniref:PHP domain-containing protein n=1 Tax=Halorussus gelatinilyticus TaxID=2937524 RepID=A0A8U0IK57_9EURY|nr:PHP domain-containing protein [Halorussus gelatinilyticus]UPW01520.1 PHP domain-containing protein [Halorussus gelatinilyticus]
MSVFADLHVHTTNSDGEMRLSEVPEAARDAGVSVVAVTDHDRLHPELPTPVTAFEGVTVVHGIELRVEPRGEAYGDAVGERVDLLGYGVTPTTDLIDELDRVQTDRKERGRKLIENVEDHLDIDLDLEPREGLGRPHVARAVVDHPDSDYEEIGDVFDDLIGDDCPCFVARDVTSFERGVELLSEACGLVGLAHPYRYDDPAAALELTRELDAVERYYPYDEEVDSRPVERAIAEHDLIPTGGSDAHGHELGKAGLSKPEYRHFRSSVNL